MNYRNRFDCGWFIFGFFAYNLFFSLNPLLKKNSNLNFALG